MDDAEVRRVADYGASGESRTRHSARTSPLAVPPEQLRELGPRTLGVLVRRGCEFTAAEDAVQDALVEAVQRWPVDGEPDAPLAWLVTAAHRRYLDAYRSAVARHRREDAALDEPAPGPTEQADDTLLLLFRCCHPALSASSAIALTLRALGGLTTREIADAYLVPEATMAQRISRAKKTIGAESLDRAGDIARVLHVLYLIYNEGYGGGRVDLAAEAIRLTRGVAAASNDPEVHGLWALMMLHHARRDARFDDRGALIPLDRQDRARWHTDEIAAGVAALQQALAADRLGEYQVQAAIAALHDDAATAAETDWPQILSWYDELLALRPGHPVVVMNRAVAVGQVDGPLAGLRATDGLDDALGDHHRLAAVRADLHERAGNRARAAELYAAAAAGATSTAERHHLTEQALRLRQA